MIVIYTQDERYTRDDADAAKSVLIEVYGEKLGAEAYAAMKDGREEELYRKYGALSSG